jgi:cyclic pyranopterin phosphate synthase
VRSAINASLVHSGITRVKINMVVMRGINDDEVPAFVELCANPKIDVRFIEFMPTTDVVYSRDLLVPEMEIRARIERPLVPVPVTDPSAPARMWMVADLPGRVGFISTMTHKFCSFCDRIRVTADGRVARCLFADTLLDLRSLIRTGGDDTAILREFSSYWSGKPARHRLDDPDFLGRPTMIAVGG